MLTCTIGRTAGGTVPQLHQGPAALKDGYEILKGGNQVTVEKLDVKVNALRCRYVSRWSSRCQRLCRFPHQLGYVIGGCYTYLRRSLRKLTPSPPTTCLKGERKTYSISLWPWVSVLNFQPPHVRCDDQTRRLVSEDVRPVHALPVVSEIVGKSFVCSETELIDICGHIQSQH